MSLGGDGDIIPAMASRYDDDLWELVPEFGSGRPPAHIVDFVHSLGQAERALDIGCGDGRLTAELDALKLYAADVSPVALDRARGRLGADTQIVELDPDADLPLEDSQFDLVLCAETLEHVRDVQLLLSEVRRVLRPGRNACRYHPRALSPHRAEGARARLRQRLRPALPAPALLHQALAGAAAR